MKRTKHTLTHSFIIIGLLFCLAACNNTAEPILSENTKPQKTGNIQDQAFSMDIQPPLEGIDIKPIVQQINANKGGTIDIESGTQIVIPPNTFVDANGVPVQGEIEVNYREFHNVTDIVASGIPMRCSKDGQAGFLKTAGMFEIRASAAGQPLTIANDKKVEVNMASYYEGSEYDFYYFDESTKAWQQTGTGTPKENTAKKQKDLQLERKTPASPMPPQKFDESRFVFDLDVDFKQFPELRAFEKVTWQYAGTSDKDNPEKNDWIFSETWEDVKVLPENMEKGLFAIHFIKGEKVFKTLATPALMGSDFDEAMASYRQKMAAYNSILGEVAVERRRLQQQANFIRSVSITNTGFHNWDYWQKQAGRMLITANFKFETSVNHDVSKIAVFHIFDKGRNVLRYPALQNVSFHFDPRQDNTIVAILPGNKAAVFSEKEFANLRLKGKEDDNMQQEFTLRTLDQSIGSLDDLKSIILGAGGV